MQPNTIEVSVEQIPGGEKTVYQISQEGWALATMMLAMGTPQEVEVLIFINNALANWNSPPKYWTAS